MPPAQRAADAGFNRARTQFEMGYCTFTVLLLYVGDFAVQKGHLHVSVDVDLLGPLVDDFTWLAPSA